MNDSPALELWPAGSRYLRGGSVIHHRQRFYLPQRLPPFEHAQVTLRGYAMQAEDAGDRARMLAAMDLAMQLRLRYELGAGAVAWAR